MCTSVKLSAMEPDNWDGWDETVNQSGYQIGWNPISQKGGQTFSSSGLKCSWITGPEKHNPTLSFHVCLCNQYYTALWWPKYAQHESTIESNLSFWSVSPYNSFLLHVWNNKLDLVQQKCVCFLSYPFIHLMTTHIYILWPFGTLPHGEGSDLIFTWPHYDLVQYPNHKPRTKL